MPYSTWEFAGRFVCQLIAAPVAVSLLGAKFDIVSDAGGALFDVFPVTRPVHPARATQHNAMKTRAVDLRPRTAHFDGGTIFAIIFFPKLTSVREGGGRTHSPRIASLPGPSAWRNWTEAAKEGSCAYGLACSDEQDAERRITGKGQATYRHEIGRRMQEEGRRCLAPCAQNRQSECRATGLRLAQLDLSIGIG